MPMGDANVVSLADKTRERSRLFLTIHSEQRGPDRRGWAMKIKDLQGVRARKSVARQFRRFVDTMMRQFTTPSHKLVERAEAKLEEQNDRAASDRERVAPGGR